MEQKKFFETGILLNSDDDEYSQGYSQNKEASGALRKDDILKPYISDNDFRSTNINAAGVAAIDNGYKLYVFYIPYQ